MNVKTSEILPQIIVHDTLSDKDIVLKDGTDDNISLYVCGATVYDHCHIGHGRIKVVFDAWVRFLRSLGYNVNYVMNITDVDDKIIKKSHEMNCEPMDVAALFIDEMAKVDQLLGIDKPSHEPRATQYMREMHDMIQKLIDSDCAYVTPQSDVYFAVDKYSDYGALSKQVCADLTANTRDVIGSDKQSAVDFVLWKSAKEGEPSWPSPWGPGRPGWHIECTAMSTSLLGETFDVHGGGMDLKFPHHENEIAQAKCAHTGEYARCWMHVGLVMMNQSKMSKSLGNTLLLKDLLDRVPADALRFMYLQTHYSKPLPYTQSYLKQAEQSWSRLDRLVKDVTLDMCRDVNIDEFISVLSRDFNTPQAITQLFDWRRQAEKASDIKVRHEMLARIKKAGDMLGLFRNRGEKIDDAEWVESMIKQRNKARAEGDYSQADRIRQDLADAGIQIEDTASGTKWRQV